VIYIGFFAYREAVNRPIAVPDSASITRSPTGSIQTITSIQSGHSDTSNGSRSTVFVPPLSSLPDIDNADLYESEIDDIPSEASTRRSSLLRLPLEPVDPVHVPSTLPVPLPLPSPLPSVSSPAPSPPVPSPPSLAPHHHLQLLLHYLQLLLHHLYPFVAISFLYRHR